MWPPARGTSGFTLLEVMIALTILMTSILALSGLHGRALRSSARSEKIHLAVQLARLKMNEKIIEFEEATKKSEFPDPKEESGTFEAYPDYRWEIKLSKMEAPPIPSMGEGQAAMEQVVGFIGEQLEKMVRVVRVTIYWEEIGSEQSLDLTTHLANLQATAGVSP